MPYYTLSTWNGATEDSRLAYKWSGTQEVALFGEQTANPIYQPTTTEEFQWYIAGTAVAAAATPELAADRMAPFSIVDIDFRDGITSYVTNPPEYDSNNDVVSREYGPEVQSTIDARDDRRTYIAALQAEGKKVVAYVPAGDWEIYRWDYNDLPAGCRGGWMNGWDSEKWVNFEYDMTACVNWVKARIDEVVSDGFDGIEFDCIEAYYNDINGEEVGFNPTWQHQFDFNEALFAYAHEQGLFVVNKGNTGFGTDHIDSTEMWLLEEPRTQLYELTTDPATGTTWVASGKLLQMCQYGIAYNATDDANARLYDWRIFFKNIALTEPRNESFKPRAPVLPQVSGSTSAVGVFWKNNDANTPRIATVEVATNPAKIFYFNYAIGSSAGTGSVSFAPDSSGAGRTRVNVQSEIAWIHRNGGKAILNIGGPNDSLLDLTTDAKGDQFVSSILDLTGRSTSNANSNWLDTAHGCYRFDGINFDMNSTSHNGRYNLATLDYIAGKLKGSDNATARGPYFAVTCTPDKDDATFQSFAVATSGGGYTGTLCDLYAPKFYGYSASVATRKTDITSNITTLKAAGLPMSRYGISAAYTGMDSGLCMGVSDWSDVLGTIHGNGDHPAVIQVYALDDESANSYTFATTLVSVI